MSYSIAIALEYLACTYDWLILAAAQKRVDVAATILCEKIVYNINTYIHM